MTDNGAHTVERFQNEAHTALPQPEIMDLADFYTFLRCLKIAPMAPETRDGINADLLICIGRLTGFLESGMDIQHIRGLCKFSAAHLAPPADHMSFETRRALAGLHRGALSLLPSEEQEPMPLHILRLLPGAWPSDMKVPLARPRLR